MNLKWTTAASWHVKLKRSEIKATCCGWISKISVWKTYRKLVRWKITQKQCPLFSIFSSNAIHRLIPQSNVKVNRCSKHTHTLQYSRLALLITSQRSSEISNVTEMFLPLSEAMPGQVLLTFYGFLWVLSVINSDLWLKGGVFDPTPEETMWWAFNFLMSHSPGAALCDVLWLTPLAVNSPGEMLPDVFCSREQNRSSWYGMV